MHELKGLTVLAWAMFTCLHKLLLLHWAYVSAVFRPEAAVTRSTQPFRDVSVFSG